MDRDKRYRDQERRFKQSHGGREAFPGGEWGSSSEFGRNSEMAPRYRESDSYDRDTGRPFDMDNYYSGRQFSVGGVDFERQNRDFDLERFNEETRDRAYSRSRFAEPYTGGQFSRSQYGMGSGYSSDRFDHSSFGYGESGRIKSGYTGKGPKGYKRSDDRIKEEVCEVLYRHPYVDASDIEVYVMDGIVTLRGNVESRNAKREAESCIENLSGIEDIRNEIRVNRSIEGTGTVGSEKDHQGDRRKH